jgi:hypothetical protein
MEPEPEIWGRFRPKGSDRRGRPEDSLDCNNSHKKVIIMKAWRKPVE